MGKVPVDIGEFPEMMVAHTANIATCLYIELSSIRVAERLFTYSAGSMPLLRRFTWKDEGISYIIFTNQNDLGFVRIDTSQSQNAKTKVSTIKVQVHLFH